MTVTAHAVAQALHDRHPGMGPSRLNSLLYFCQGHHLADLNEPLFDEPIHATAEGVIVEDIVEADPAVLDNSQLNTVGYVISRYGNLSPDDLRVLVRSADPWRFATSRPEDLRVELAWIQDWFRRTTDLVEAGEPKLSREQMAKLAAQASSRLPGDGRVTSREDILARIKSTKDRMASAP